jgi:hypothetical protein
LEGWQKGGWGMEDWEKIGEFEHTDAHGVTSKKTYENVKLVYSSDE